MNPLAPRTPIMDALEALSPAQWRAQCRVQGYHLAAMLAQGIPIRDLVRGGLFTFGIAVVAGREMIATDDARLRGYLSGPGLFALPE